MRSTIHILFISILFLTLVSAARAATFVVDRADDPLQGIPLTCSAAPNDCSLRGAIVQANNNGAGADTINFNIPGGGVKTITLTERLYNIQSSLTINGATQPGYFGKPLIELKDGDEAEYGLVIVTNAADISVTVIGLAVNSFDAYGIILDCGTRCDLTLLGNFIGTDPTGTIDKGNGTGVNIKPSPNAVFKIGGTGAFEGNVISGNSFNGIAFDQNTQDTGNAQVTILGNKIGTDYSGTVKIANGGEGVSVVDAEVKVALTVGGGSPAAANVISGNGKEGIFTICSKATIKGNYIGTNSDGSAALGNAEAGMVTIVEDGFIAEIGGAAAGEGNVVSGNLYEGIDIRTQHSEANGAKVFVRGNFVGTNAAGTAAVGNVLDGISINTGEGNNADVVIGGVTAAERNVISGNDSSGLTIRGSNVFVYNNYIGTDATGTSALGNDYAGINVVYHGRATIGGTVVENGVAYDAGNTISGNFGSGIVIPDFAEFPVVIKRNRIGTNAAGTFTVPNTGSGIAVSNIGSIIGSDTNAADGNTISGNLKNGISISYTGQQTYVYANKIGTNSLGGSALPNGKNGIEITESAGNQIGLAGMGAATNIISGNVENGIRLTGQETTGNRVENNIIGAGTIGNDLGNGDDGVLIDEYASQNFVGSTSGTGNTIAFNRRGIYLKWGWNNEFRRNRIFSNDELGIDLGVDGVAQNDQGDADGGANDQQNFPVLSAVSPNNIAGTLNSAPNTSYEIDFFRSDACDASGYGEGRVLLASQTVTTDAAGNASFNQFAVLTLGQAVSATATVSGAGANDTSEFSNCKIVTSAASVALAALVYSVNEGGTQRTIVVERAGDTSGTITVDYATTDGTAVAGQDYTATSGTLTFNGGEIAKTFDIPVVNDTADESDETVHIALSNVNGGFPGFPSTSTLTIVDNDDPPTISVSDVASVEGTGGNTEFTFHVTLSAASALPVTVDFATANGTADLSDYMPLNGQVDFAAGEISKPVTVSVIGDAAPESSETFAVNLSNPSNATLADIQGTGTILDDDLAYSISGTIREQDSSPLGNVTVQLTGKQSAQTTTDLNGRYTFENLPVGGNYTITPSAPNYIFDPTVRQYFSLAARVDNADFTALTATPRQVQIIGGVTTPGQPATITTELVAQGGERSVHFSLSYDPTILSDPQITLLPNSQASGLWTHVSIPGEIGVMLWCPQGQTYPAGTRQLVAVTFQTAMTNVASTPITFTDTPTDRVVYDIDANILPSNYVDSLVGFIQGGYEADVSPRPTGTGNGTVTVADVTQIGRFVAGLDTISQNFNEFQRADSAPRDSLGNGALSVADFTQAGRYAAGLDTVQTAGGATVSNLLEFDAEGKLSAESRAALDKSNDSTKNDLQNLVPTAVRVVSAQTSPGSQVTVSIATDATGVENGFGFTLGFDAAKLSNPVVANGIDAQSATLITNTATPGKIGVVLAMPAGQTLLAGERQLVTIQFTAANAPAGFTPLTFGDTPVLREVSDLNAGVLLSNFQDGAINILGPTAAEVTIGGRVRTPKGKGLVNVLVALTDGNGQTRTTKTNAFGYYRFPGVEVGELYILTVSAKKQFFNNPVRVVMVQDEMDDLDFVSEN